MKWALLLFTFIVFVVASAISADVLPLAEPCDEELCKLPDCRCSSTVIPGNLKPHEVPQFVLLTFDDGVNVVNVATYRDILYKRKNSNECPIGVSFYISHEYTNYELVNELYNEGFEIALHSITHVNQTYFQEADYDRMMLEFADQKTLMSHFAAIPESSIEGLRIPFLQMTGNSSFQMMKSAGLRYDITWPTTRYTDPGLWPYTLDYQSIQDCITPPCPSASLPGAWVVPMIAWTDLSNFPCAMVDACFSLPGSNDEDGWFRFIIDNFERHYGGNRAPFGFFIHEGTVRTQPGLRRALIRFMDMINSMSDVFMVNTGEMLDWVQNPVPLGEYIQKPCRLTTPARCRPASCGPLVAPHKEELFYMQVCARCPRTYPWLGNPLGE
ncbi:chitin deacetylase 8 [Zerene cesonia]|uniref:chitin deacetylase 8 n=1 Tax=Zerene cesonia TaxID=33412 RepID=UPI0018E57983|nr:chitin deacetylase 8 [Zerene cesonia]